jgi:predicted glycoside hydrolase/deacetylase ChbG (UPF0249 family)
VDALGYFHQERNPVYEKASPEAVSIEVNAQVELALAAGIDVTHVDSHMGTITNSKFVQSYLQAAVSRMLPNMLPRASVKGYESMGIREDELAQFVPLLHQFELVGVPMLDGLFSMPLYDERDHIGAAKKLLSAMPVGISHFILHPAVDTPELRAICSDWPSRVANYNAFMSDEIKDFLKNSGIKLIGYRQIRNAMRN